VAVKRSGKFYRRNESEVMTSLGLKPTKGSGAGWIEKEDGQSEHVIAQLKSTDAKSIRINMLDLQKLEHNALVSHKLPVFFVQFLETNDVYLLCRPLDLPDLAQYIQTGRYEVTDQILIEDVKHERKVALISSGNREQYHAEREEHYARNKSKSRR